MTENKKLREALLAYHRATNFHERLLASAKADQALATTEQAVNQQLTTEPLDEREAFTDDTKDALVKVIDAARAKGVKW